MLSLRLHVLVVASPVQRCDDDVAGAWNFASIANNSFSFTFLSRVFAQHILSVSHIYLCSRQHHHHYQPSCIAEENPSSRLIPLSVSPPFFPPLRTSKLGYSHSIQSAHTRRPRQASHPASRQGWQVHDHIRNRARRRSHACGRKSLPFFSSCS